MFVCLAGVPPCGTQTTLPLLPPSWLRARACARTAQPRRSVPVCQCTTLPLRGAVTGTRMCRAVSVVVRSASLPLCWWLQCQVVWSSSSRPSSSFRCRVCPLPKYPCRSAARETAAARGVCCAAAVRDQNTPGHPRVSASLNRDPVVGPCPGIVGDAGHPLGAQDAVLVQGLADHPPVHLWVSRGPCPTQRRRPSGVQPSLHLPHFRGASHLTVSPPPDTSVCVH